MSKYARKLEKIESGNRSNADGSVQMIIMFCPVLVVHMARNYYQSRCVIA